MTMLGFDIRGRRTGLDEDVRERRLEVLQRTVERFTFALGMLISGREAPFADCASPMLADRMRTAIEPFLATGDTLRPDFGTHGELRIEGDLLDTDTPVSAFLEFEDRSVREHGDGATVAVPRRRVRLLLTLSLHPCSVVDCAVELLPG